MSIEENIKRLRELSAGMDFDYFSTVISSIADETADALETLSAELEKMKKNV